MFKLTTRARYGLRAAVQLAEAYGSDQPLRLADMSERQNVSVKYLHAVIASLRNGGIVLSTRGARGGFQLARDPAEISAFDVLVQLEGSLNLVECLKPGQTCGREDICTTQGLWKELTDLLTTTLKSVSLARLVECEGQGGILNFKRPLSRNHNCPK